MWGGKGSQTVPITYVSKNTKTDRSKNNITKPSQQKLTVSATTTLPSSSTTTTTTSTSEVRVEGGLQTINLDDKGSFLYWCPNFLSSDEADSLYTHLISDGEWSQSERTIKENGQDIIVLTPRLQSWMSTPGKHVASLYQKKPPVPWTDLMLDVKTRIETLLNNSVQFDYVLMNLYRNGRDSIAFHRDDEASGINPETGSPRNIIASISLGAKRTFVMRKTGPIVEKQYGLTNGSLIIMAGETQEHWKHAIPKDPSVQEPRMNLTFRVS
eukprot:TRINITY_DN446_c0_g1_i1.p1 TRINITY_DN446_c0_g1~~TRINITY_DN446_c0_g1_i1.p1  ORF type:complete len:269 (+),score=47.60 TRINITY_DN446_c0_g1_i1:32-838(+)